MSSSVPRRRLGPAFARLWREPGAATESATALCDTDRGANEAAVEEEDAKCAAALRAYGACLRDSLQGSTIEHGACETEFDAVRRCMRYACATTPRS